MTITIDGVEVVCSNDFTIKEDILNTPSVILNNVYPKSWETDKDYTSRFYHPNDYSQCIITKSELPDEYQEVDYLQSNGSQYIKINNYFTTTASFILDFAPETITGSCYYFGGRSGNYSIGVWHGSSSTKLGIVYNGDYGSKTVYTQQNIAKNRYRIEAKVEPYNSQYRVHAKVSNLTSGITEEVNTPTSGALTVTYPIYLFGVSSNYKTAQKLYSCEIYDDGALVNKLIPCKRKSDSVLGMYDIVTNTFYTNNGTGSFTYGSEVEHKVFCGVVKNSGQISLNPRHPHYSTLQILDYKTFLSEGELNTFVIAEKTILEAIQMVIDDISGYGFELGNVSILNSEDIIGAYSTKDKSAYDVFNYIADITQSRWTTRMLDAGRVVIDFYDPTLMSSGTAIDYTQTWFKNNKIIDISYNYGTWDYRNKQVMTSREVFGDIPQIQTILYDGYATQIMTEYPIGTIQNIKVNGVSKDFMTNDEKSIGYSADFFYAPGNNYFERNMSIGVGSEIVITYIPIVEGRQIVNNSTEISRVATATGVKGIVSRYESRNDARTSTELQKIGQSYIKYKGTPEIRLKVVTESNLWNIGQRVQFNAPITELDTEYMVKKKDINYIVTANQIFYTYELSSSFNSESEINYFDNQRAKANGNIKEGQFISRNIDLESVANIIFYDTTATSTSITSDSTLQSTLETILGG